MTAHLLTEPSKIAMPSYISHVGKPPSCVGDSKICFVLLFGARFRVSCTSARSLSTETRLHPKASLRTHRFAVAIILWTRKARCRKNASSNLHIIVVSQLLSCSPPNVWGPYSHFSLEVIQKLRKGTLALVSNGQNPCNLVHVDNLVEAILLSLWKPKL